MGSRLSPCAGLTSHAAQAHWLVLEQELIEINKDIKLCENCMRYVHLSLAAAVQVRIRPMMRRKYGEPFTHPLNHLKACSIDRTALHIGRHCIACTELFPREEYTVVCFSADACAHSMFRFPRSAQLACPIVSECGFAQELKRSKKSKMKEIIRSMVRSCKTVAVQLFR